MSNEQQGKSALPTVLVIVGVVLVGVVVIVGVLAALAISGFRGYMARAKSVEGRSEVQRLAAGIRQCAEDSAASDSSTAASLPASAPPVPGSLADISGKKYMSSPADWTGPSYTCARFSLSTPQYFQYEWQQTSPSSGKAIARADLDGDGRPEIEYTAAVTCSGPSCSVTPPTGP